jgi:hypothetical protein
VPVFFCVGGGAGKIKMPPLRGSEWKMQRLCGVYTPCRGSHRAQGLTPPAYGMPPLRGFVLRPTGYRNIHWMFFLFSASLSKLPLAVSSPVICRPYGAGMCHAKVRRTDIPQAGGVSPCKRNSVCEMNPQRGWHKCNAHGTEKRGERVIN